MMAESKVLASPINLRQTALPKTFPESMKEPVARGSSFVQYSHPYKTYDRFFVGMEPQWGGINAIEFTENLPVAYVKKFTTNDTEKKVGHLRATHHHNLVNLKEAFVTDNSVFFVYERWGISLEEICQLWPVFKLGEVEVATLCNEVLNGLSYIHDELGVGHGDLCPENIFVMENGDVKIGNVGESMIRASNPCRKTQDLQAVCAMIRNLLRLDKAEEAGGTSNFSNIRFLKSSPGAGVFDR
ncbi:uncharacterized protein KD926_008238 [Aspergillus affinis]|uniref:uncharacterized protein n=1 Tax=Aspergillus affinis TaxID=1070780 RepID=UPI0022FE312F|nr:uncharacterized protein KD926_008238 [Aspergillus affinis]KAI9040415.1 hypothetical protein KD926_008238 [Aspergillus affinis]